MKISKSKNFKDEYCASILKIGEMFPIEGKDRIVKTFLNGLSIVVGKEDYKEGDVIVYCPIETVLPPKFLHINNMYEDKSMNENPEEKGYINKHGRIRIVKLGGIASQGLILNPKSIAKYTDNSVEDVVKFLEKHVGEDFDEMNDERFVKVYVPKIKKNEHVTKGDKRNNKLKKFNMLTEDTNFRYHYDTAQFAKEIKDFNPEDKVYISNKLHGTSAIFSNIITNIPTNWLKRMWRKYILKTNEYDQKYNLIYSSRTVIKNQFINPNQKSGGYYGDDVWGHWAAKLDGFIPKGYNVYGEILGFTPNGSPIQKQYDYGCIPGESKLMVYRITNDGKELEVPEVIEFGKQLKEKLGDEIIEFPLLFEGTLQELYPDVDVQNHWHENVLEKMKNEKRFRMEQMEPMCKNKVPVEGIVVRKANDPVSEAFKLKTISFKMREAKQVDQGEVDIEMNEGYSE